MNQARIAVVHPLLKAGGGSEAPALWTIEALKERHAVYLITQDEVDLEVLNLFYGTDIQRRQVQIVNLPVFPLFQKKFDALRNWKLSRYCRRHSSDFHLMISTYNVMDFGRPGIQFIADFSFSDKLRQYFHPVQAGLKGLLYQNSPIRAAYLRLGEYLSGSGKKGWTQNITLANSEWTKRVLYEKLGIASKVVYPPVPDDYPSVTWKERENGFACVSRLAPEKKIESIIEIVRRLKIKESSLHLHIIGNFSDISYERKLKKISAAHKEWIIFEGAKYGREKKALLARHKFGIHACNYEAFGIAVAEMVKAGCIVWVPAGGGQVEIVNHPCLIYDGINDAAAKIETVLKDDQLQQGIRVHLREEADKFSTGRFIEEVRKVVSHFLKENGKIQ